MSPTFGQLGTPEALGAFASATQQGAPPVGQSYGPAVGQSGKGGANAAPPGLGVNTFDSLYGPQGAFPGALQTEPEAPPAPTYEGTVQGPYGEFGGFGPDAYGAYAGAAPEGYGGFGGGFGGGGYGGAEGAGAYGSSGPEGSYGGSFGGGFDG